MGTGEAPMPGRGASCDCPWKALYSLYIVCRLLAVLTTQVKGLNYTYWAYIPNPPLMRGVSWTDVTVPIYTNDSNRMPGPFDDRGPLKPDEEGTRMNNYSTGVIGMPVCLGQGDHCLQLGYQAWLSVAKNTTNP